MYAAHCWLHLKCALIVLCESVGAQRKFSADKYRKSLRCEGFEFLREPWVYGSHPRQNERVVARSTNRNQMPVSHFALQQRGLVDVVVVIAGLHQCLIQRWCRRKLVGAVCQCVAIE